VGGSQKKENKLEENNPVYLEDGERRISGKRKPGGKKRYSSSFIKRAKPETYYYEKERDWGKINE